MGLVGGNPTAQRAAPAGRDRRPELAALVGALPRSADAAL
jgi:hypothetical protein